MKFKPHMFQKAGIDHAFDFLTTAALGAKQLYASPTGTGKSVVELLLQERLNAVHPHGAFIITPRSEIQDGMLDKLGAPYGADPADYDIWTPIMLRNRLLTGEVRHPKWLILDETHHHEATSWQEVELLSGICPSVGYTASPYRGSPRSTKAFRDNWGDPIWLIDYAEAIAEGYIKMPHMSILPLVDDDIVEVNGGEFNVTSLEQHTMDRLDDMVDHAKKWYSNGKWDKATIFALPGSLACMTLAKKMSEAGLPNCVVTAATSRSDRPTFFKATEERILALIHINVVQEGVDLRLERLVDMAATMSPVKWVQQIGRIMRPTVAAPEYICTNRNVLRHAYILDGIVPIDVICETERKFGESQRGHSRVLGLEAIGRFKPTATKLLNGANLYVYWMSTLQGTAQIEFACIVHPTMEPMWAVKANTRSEGGEKQWGSWSLCEAPEGLTGFSSKGAKEPSEKQQQWWDRSAARFGLDPTQELNRRSFIALPVLADLGVRL